MKLVAISQRVYSATARGERWDCLDQRWSEFLEVCGLQALPMPNHKGQAAMLLQGLNLQGLILTGGGDLYSLGGDSPERDEVEELMVSHALEHKLPLLGICRGMQFLAQYFGGILRRVEGHVGSRHLLDTLQGRVEVNSFHQWGLPQAPSPLRAWARDPQGNVEAFKHTDLPVFGLMWHPEREEPPSQKDVALMDRIFVGGRS